MFCKLNDDEEALSILCFSQQSNLFSKMYLGAQRPIQFITTCGHFAHSSCYKNVNKEKEYTFCYFCKTSSNLLLTANSERKTSLDLQTMQLEEEIGPALKRKTKSMSQKGPLLFSLEQMEQINDVKLQDALTDKQKIIEKVANFVVYGAIVDYQFFIRSQAKICYYLLSSLAYSNMGTIKNLFKQIDQAFSKHQIDEKKNIFQKAYKFSILSVASVLGTQRDTDNKNWDIRTLQESLPQQLAQNIVHIITSIGKPKSLKFLNETKIIPFCPPQFRALPTTLSDLSKEIGTCPCCSRITNEIALCLLCDFKSCVGCQTQNLVSHSQKSHASASIFIRVDEGYPLYVSPRKNRQLSSLYLNFMGQTFTLDSLYKKKLQERSEYKLDTVSYNKIKNDIIRHRIEQQVRYIELTTSKESIINP